MLTLRVRPGFIHGARKQYHGGVTLTVPEDEATQLLAAFGDKLEDVSGPSLALPASVTFQVSSEAAEVLPADEPGTAVETVTPEPIPAKRSRKAGGL